ncbi:MAG TPA: hypothetical protein PLM92_04200 [Bacillota bacterium]|nr:hypothetical protein [Bacillota bacterium]HUM55536.1 hypothetical protein [Bacillota bacterium]
MAKKLNTKNNKEDFAKIDENDAGTIVCTKCNVSMEPIDVTFKYLKRSFRHKVLRCSKCGQVYVPEDLAKGRMAEVEAALEEK